MASSLCTTHKEPEWTCNAPNALRVHPCVKSLHSQHLGRLQLCTCRLEGAPTVNNTQYACARVELWTLSLRAVSFEHYTSDEFYCTTYNASRSENPFWKSQLAPLTSGKAIKWPYEYCSTWGQWMRLRLTFKLWLLPSHGQPEFEHGNTAIFANSSSTALSLKHCINAIIRYTL